MGKDQDREAYIDGSSTGLYGYLLLPEGRTKIVKDIECTNNQAEWRALITLLLDLPEGWKGTVYSDSELVVRQFNGVYKVKDHQLKKLYRIAFALLFKKKIKVTMKWIPRKENLFGKELERYIAQTDVDVLEIGKKGEG